MTYLKINGFDVCPALCFGGFGHKKRDLSPNKSLEISFSFNLKLF
jgi:hypothetical protein